MADTLEIRLGGAPAGRRLGVEDLDYSEVSPLLKRILTATEIEANIDRVPVTLGRPKSRRGTHRELRAVRLALASVKTAADGEGPVASYLFAVGAEAAEAVGKITAGLSGSAVPLVPEAAAEVAAGISRAIGSGLSVQLVNGVTTPRFTSSNPPPKLAVSPTRRCEGQIAAKLLRVGGHGKHPLARVELLGSGHQATLTLSGKQAARELGNHLYSDAVLFGVGEWVIDQDRFGMPTRLLHFRVDKYRLLDDATMGEVVDNMAAASAGGWDGVDPSQPEPSDDK